MAAAGVSEDFKDQFRCASCKKYLRPPVITCVKGHNICELCHASLTFKKCPTGRCAYTKPLVQNATIEAMLKTLRLPMSCKHDGCDVELGGDEICAHEEECPHRKIRCPVLTCRREVKLIDLERHLPLTHEFMMNGNWHPLRFDPETGGAASLDDTPGRLKNKKPLLFGRRNLHEEFGSVEDLRRLPDDIARALAVSNGATATAVATSSSIKKCYMKTWMQSGDMRMFAAAILKDDFWYVWSMVSGTENQAKKFRCKIRLESDKHPFSTTFCGPVMSIENPILNLAKQITAEKFANERGCFIVHSTMVKTEMHFMCKITEVQSPADEALCIMCQDRRPEVVLAPCGHQNVCGPCAHEWNGRPPRDGGGSCPMCRQPIAMIVSPIPL